MCTLKNSSSLLRGDTVIVLVKSVLVGSVMATWFHLQKRDMRVNVHLW